MLTLGELVGSGYSAVTKAQETREFVVIACVLGTFDEGSRKEDPALQNSIDSAEDRNQEGEEGALAERSQVAVEEEEILAEEIPGEGKEA